MAKISVIMPSLNVADYIGEALNSVRHQTLEDIEIICIDAGSTDGTWGIIEDAAKDDSRIIALQSLTKSYGFQVNKGFDRASGEYIAVLETDDYAAPEMYEKLYEAAHREKLDYVKCDYRTYTAGGDGRLFVDRKVSVSQALYEHVFEPSDYPETVVDDWYLWNGVYRTDFLRRNNIRLSETPGAAFQDVGFLYWVSVKAKKVSYISDSLYFYCVDRDGSSSNSGRALKFIHQEYGILLEHICDLSDIEKRLLYRRMIVSFVRACQGTCYGVLCDDDIRGICIWFRGQFLKAEDEGFISESDLSGFFREVYFLVRDSMERYLEYRLSRENELSDFLNKCSGIIIFGCGNFGRDALQLLKRKGIEIVGFMDNNSALWGKEIDGFEVFSSQRIIDFSDNTGYLVANEKYADDIIVQIRSYKDVVRIYRYDGVVD